MSTAREVQAISATIDSVERRLPVMPRLPTRAERSRAAMHLSNGATDVLGMLRGAMTTVDKDDYDVLYAALEDTDDGSMRHLQAAEAMWRFALRVFHRESRRYNNAAQPSPRSPGTAPQPTPTVYAYSSPPVWHSLPRLPTYVPTWFPGLLPVYSWWAPASPAVPSWSPLWPAW